MPVGIYQRKARPARQRFDAKWTPDDLTIDGDLAYLYTGYGAVFQVDIDGLTKAIDEHLDARSH